MTNQEILDKLLLRQEEDTEGITVESRCSFNGTMCNKYLVQWNKNESDFPMQDIQKYIRMNEWSAGDFNTSLAIFFMTNLPKWFYAVYSGMENFISNTRNELSSLVFSYAKLMGYPMNTQAEKAFCLYNYLIQENEREVQCQEI